MKVGSLAVADVFSTALLGLSSYQLFNDIYIFYFGFFMNSCVAILIIMFMKDVINEKDFEARRVASNSETSKTKRAKVVCNQAMTLLLKEPYFIFAIVGGMYSIVTSVIGNSNTIIAVTDAFKARGDPDFEANSKWYYCKLKLI